MCTFVQLAGQNELMPKNGILAVSQIQLRTGQYDDDDKNSTTCIASHSVNR
jgi:hypothetical protein